MKSNVLQYLGRSVAASPEKTAVLDDRTRYTYRQLDELRRRIGTALCGMVPQGSPVGVYMDKCADAIAVFLGVVSAGCFYSVLNPELPPQRLGRSPPCWRRAASSPPGNRKPPPVKFSPGPILSRWRNCWKRNPATIC